MAGDWFDGNGTGSAVDPSEVLGDLGNAGVLDLVTAGALVSMGLTSDGGALSLTVTCDGRWRREYFRDAAALQEWIAEALPAVMAARNGGSPSSAPKQRTRSRPTR